KAEAYASYVTPATRAIREPRVVVQTTSEVDILPTRNEQITKEIKILPQFPGHFAKSIKQVQEKEILETFRKVEVNIPLLDAIKQVPRYAKFLREFCTSKRKLKGMFTIICKRGNAEIERAMLGLGASINVMPCSIYKAMNVGKLKETKVIIQLADCSYAYPNGVLEDILVHAKDLVFLTDFYFVDMGKDNHSSTPSILLGRPFLKTARTNICIHEGTLTIIDVIDSLVQKVFELNDEDSIKVALTNTISQSANHELKPNSNIQEAISELNSLAPFNKRVSYIGLPLNNSKLLPSIMLEPKLKLKKLPDHLKYLFLREGDTLPVISINKLTLVEDERLIRILRDYKEAIVLKYVIGNERMEGKKKRWRWLKNPMGMWDCGVSDMVDLVVVSDMMVVVVNGVLVILVPVMVATSWQFLAINWWRLRQSLAF
nr:hypothetical protein [Tanacetum cinerariifolium]